MGTWGTAIFADDFACDVRAAYLGLLAGGSATAASRAVRKSYGAMDDDDDEGPIFWFALAATQWEYGALDPIVKRRALALLDANKDFADWTGDARRAAVRAALAKKLRTKPPRPKRPRPAKPIEIPSISVASPDGSAIGWVSSWGDGAQVTLEIPSLGGGGGVCTVACPMEAVRLRWPDKATLEVSYPSKARMEPAIGNPKAFYLSGRTIALRFRKRRT